MRKGTVIYILVSCCLSFISAKAQDPHFTQFTRIPSYYNPAATGANVEHIRLTMLYRNQWASVTSPFKTQALFFDKQVSKVGFGINILNNSSGPAGIKQMFLNGSLAYHQSFGKHTVAAGLQVGLVQKSFDPSAMTFDDQYNPDQGFNAATPTNETFSYTKLTRPDAGFGMLWSMNTSGEKICPYAGVSFMHFNQPKESFIETDNKIPVKYSFQSGAAVRINEQLVVTPSILYNHQLSAREMIYGLLFMIPMQERSHVEAGIFNRHNDALTVYAGYRVNSLMAGISYDMNTSGITHGMGAFELTVTYIPKAKEHNKIRNKTDQADGTKAVDGVVLKAPIKQTNDADPADPDNDGILNSKDKCPDAAGPAWNNGCPVTDIDADGDGIPDKVDHCPYIKGTAAMQGCPDTDGDGIIDSQDKCPLLYGSLADKGCPVQKKSAGKSGDTAIGNIEFITGSDQVKGIYKLDYIEPVLDSLNAHAEYKLVITGHTDNEGDEQFNMNLSQQRADAVKMIFIRKGLDESRITTVAYGETMPLRNNDAEEGRAANRRAEIHLVINPKP